MKTVVNFYFHEANNDLYAVFPTQGFFNGCWQGYASMGQHTLITEAYIEESRPATPEESRQLEQELQSIGYA